MTPPITLVSGYLGSGKTTLLRRALERGLGGRRVALIVNEIGAVGFDGRTLAASGAELVELADGCVCCSAGSDFLLAVEELSELVDPELIVVEASGLADPVALARRATAAGLALDALVALADALALPEALARSPVARRQIRAADLLVLSKVDVASPEERAAAEALLRAENPRAAILPVANGEVDPALLLGLPRPAGRGPDEALADHLAAEGASWLLWEGDVPLERGRLAAALTGLPAAVYRAKGLVHCTDAPWPSLINLVCGRLDDEATRLRERPPRLNRLVLIGAGLGPLADELRRRLDACADTPERAAAWLANAID